MRCSAFGVEDLAGLGGAPDFLGQRQRRAAVAVGHAQQHRPRLLVERQRPALGLLGARQQLLEALLAKRMERQHPRARQKRGVELEGRVLGGRADQDDGAVLHDRQEAVLLGAVEAMDLVDEEQRLAAVRAAQPAPPRTPSSGRRRRKRSPISARRRGSSRRPAAARPSSCRCRAAPRRSSSRASPSGSAASARRPRRSDAPGRRPRPRFFGRSRSASGAAVRRLVRFVGAEQIGHQIP